MMAKRLKDDGDSEWELIEAFKVLPLAGLPHTLCARSASAYRGATALQSAVPARAMRRRVMPCVSTGGRRRHTLSHVCRSVAAAGPGRQRFDLCGGAAPHLA